MRPWLLVLGGASPQQGLRCIRQARARGLSVWLTDTPANLEHAPDVVALADRVSPLSFDDPAACVAWATRELAQHACVGVFGFREYAVEAVAHVAAALDVPGNAPLAVRTVRDKLACRRALTERGFRQPASQLCSDIASARAFADRHRPGPWIVKPPAAMGSEGVSIVRDERDWSAAVAHLGKHASRPFLVECFQSGDEYSAEGVFVDGAPHVLAITSKLTSGPPHFVELGHTMSADLPTTVAAHVHETVAAALRALGLCWGIFHVELWLDDGIPVLGEVHVRPGGDQIHRMVEHVTGIELYGAVFDQMLRRSVDVRHWPARRGAAIRFLNPSVGTVSAIDGWDQVLADPACVDAELIARPGGEIRPLASWLDRSGFILATGDTGRSAAAAADRLCRMVQVQVDRIDTSKPAREVIGA